jgi:exopolysaccharide biosynthesis polyprenyl glycosylphosphotransferase
MLRVFRHYLPLRRGLLVLSETVLLFAVLAVGMSMHLRDPSTDTMSRLVQKGLAVDEAQGRCLISAFLLAVLSQVAIAFNELYDFRISISRFTRAARFVSSAGTAVAVGLGAAGLARVWKLESVLDFPGLSGSSLAQMLVVSLLCGFALLYVWRNVFHFLLRRWNFNERVLILGAGPAAQSLADEMLEHADSGYEVLAMLPEAPGNGSGEANGPTKGSRARLSNGHARRSESERADRLVGAGSAAARPAEAKAARTLLLEPITVRRKAPGAAPLSEAPAERALAAEAALAKPLSEPLFDLVQRLRIDLVVVALEDRRGHLPTDELLHCRLAGIGVKEREALYEHITGKIAVEAMRPSYLIFNDGFGRTPQGDLAKRGADIALSSLGILLTWPVMAATAIVVRMDSPGPILFKQERVGRDGLPFTLLKFRSMRVDAEKLTGAVWATENDPRMTRSGRFIRRARLDELPQLFNVLAGSMSLVGPRPERPVFVEDLSRQLDYYSQRHIVKPGLTGWAQINYPYGNTVEDALQKLQYDLFYIKNQSLLFDLSILFNTIKTVLLRKGT